MRGLRSGAKKGVAIVVEEIENASPYPAVDTRAMINSVDSRGTGTGVQIFVGAPHAIFMEEGTRPHTPPLDPILEWVLRKGFASSEKDARHIAFAVQQKIAREGIAPRRFFRKAMRRIIGEVIPREIQRELRALARRKS